MKSSFLLLVFFMLASCLWAQNTSKISMADCMGVNTNVASYDNKYLADLSKCVKWIREYHNWTHYEAANNFYKWDNITKEPQGYTWPEHTDFMTECHKLGINVLIDVLGKTDWAGTSPIPVTSGTGSNASEYIERLEFIGQLVARYGSKKINTSLLETADKATGLNYVNYYEDDNEPDYTWKSPLWTATNYAKYCNAVHDGFGVQTDADHPLLGIKSVDPNAKHVLAGMAGADTVYINGVLKASGGRIPFDILNIHWYCNDHTNAYSPENEQYGYEVSFRNFFKWKNRNLPNIPVWLTEFGWDTYLAPDNKHSYTYAPPLQQANYILRSYLILLKLGFEKSFLFMDTDLNSKSTLQYSASGLFTDKNSKYAKKLSYYYLATMQNVLGKTDYSKAVSYKQLSGNNEIYCMEFANPVNSEKVYALWTRKTGSNTDDGSKTSYQFNPGYVINSAYSVIPADLDMDGDTVKTTLINNKIELNLTETPQFVVVSGNNTTADSLSTNIGLHVFPNPAHAEVQIELSVLEKQIINVSAYTLEGKLVKTMVNDLLEEGIHHYNFGNGQVAGVYFLNVSSSKEKTVRKIILAN
ncbi:MAG: T9SS type A sorting domain-containing protein [Prolixibacteraceae bacterium]|nr:T9SS type A sorting domain-containing protein [Prolixibacteraceae bacterium]